MLSFNNRNHTAHLAMSPSGFRLPMAMCAAALQKPLQLEGYPDQTLTLYQISEMLGLSRGETEDFLGRRQVPLSEINEADLDREAAVFEGGSHRTR
jgi:hypothetical protein